MTDFEQRIRDLLGDDAQSAPPPHEVDRVARRTRRRQAVTIAGSLLGAVALATASVVGVRALSTTDGTTPADATIVTSTMNGISITHPDGWQVIDPDEAGLNGSDPAPGFPRLILALAATDTRELFGCPGIVEGTMPTFLMTVQEEPLTLSGDAAASWPAELEELFTQPTQTGSAGSAEGGCYPGWDFLRAGWTAAGRTFEARVGLAPEIGSEDRESLFAAFASMTFEPAESGGQIRAVLDEGVIGGETWQLFVERDQEGLQLSVDTPNSSAGMGGFSTEPGQLQWSELRIGSGPDERVLVFGALPIDVVRLEATGEQTPESASVIDVPDEIDDQLGAFLLVMVPDQSITIEALTAEGEVVAMADITAGGQDPVGTPPPLPEESIPQHGGRYWAVYVWVGDSVDDPEVELAVGAAEDLGFNPAVGDLACDDDAASELGLPSGWSGVAIYFATRHDAQIAFEQLFMNYREPDGLAAVTTYCLD